MGTLEKRLGRLEQADKPTTLGYLDAMPISPEDASAVYHRLEADVAAGLAANRTAGDAAGRLGPPRKRNWAHQYRLMCEGKPIDDRF